MEKRIGVYVCTGCGIGEAIDTGALAKITTDEYRLHGCKEHPFLCSTEGVSLIQGDVVKEGLGAVVIAACSPRVMTDVFQFASGTVIERVNLREQVVWSHPPDDEDTRMLAEDQLRMGIVKAMESEPPVPFQEGEFSKRLLVVGGGLTGMTAAMESARAGYDVVLVEKSDELGGYLKQVYKLPPAGPPYEEIRDSELDALVQEIEAEPKITVYTKARIDRIVGAPCMFDVSVSQNGSEAAERVGAIVVATGSVPYDAHKLEHLGFGKFPDVITGQDLEAMFRSGSVVRPSNGEP
ncbi:MAG: CoB--CoM heterodisulfide reductase iron-sulfur subunit A family protein, partial [Syntrophobacteraceae bacterium]|nr:CoB--CoM heterodisulfide reductase iron-sulfur subunit A family protein [Syntrophobacteraceae bacterium]